MKAMFYSVNGTLRYLSPKPITGHERQYHKKVFKEVHPAPVGGATAGNMVRGRRHRRSSGAPRSNDNG